MLYIVATPIGNLNDLSLRQAQTIAQADYVLAEDTRSASTLISFISSSFGLSLNPNQSRISYYKEKEFEKLPEIMTLLEEGKSIALISESGMPIISDPGSLLTQTLAKRHLPFTVIPGPTAFVTAAALSGLSFRKLMFHGFLPKEKSKVDKVIRIMTSISAQEHDVLHLFYESPNRIQDTLSILSVITPKARVAICRELTKKFEEVVRGIPSELIGTVYKGELTIALKLE